MFPLHSFVASKYQKALTLMSWSFGSSFRFWNPGEALPVFCDLGLGADVCAQVRVLDFLAIEY